MNRKELLIISVGIFLTIIAWMLVDIYQVQNSTKINENPDIKTVSNYKINDTIFRNLLERTP